MAVPSPAEDLSLLRTCSAGKLCVNLSFGSNILLVILKIIAYSLSLSMSVLASMVDSCLDILSGLVLFICARLARSGAEDGTPGLTEAPEAKYHLSHRKEAL